VHLLDHESAVDQQLLERIDREQAGVRQIEDASLAVVELAEEEAQAHDEERDVARARVERPAGLQDLGDLADAFLGALQVLEHVEHEHAVVLVPAERCGRSLRRDRARSPRHRPHPKAARRRRRSHVRPSARAER